MFYELYPLCFWNPDSCLMLTMIFQTLLECVIVKYQRSVYVSGTGLKITKKDGGEAVY